MGDELVDLQLVGHVIVDQVWQLRAAFDTAESAAFPYTAGNELERYEAMSVFPPIGCEQFGLGSAYVEY